LVIGKKQGVAILVFGLLLLTGGILVLVTVPSWGDWIAGYPAQAAQTAQQQVPAQAAPVVQAILGVILGPIITQVGHYIRIAGYFGGSLLTLIAIVLSTVGSTIIGRAGHTAG
jgi:hypothetical protein